MKWVLVLMMFVGEQPPTVAQIPVETKELCEKAAADSFRLGYIPGSTPPKRAPNAQITNTCLKVSN